MTLLTLRPLGNFSCFLSSAVGAQWLSGRVLDSRLKGRGFEPHWRHCVVSLSKNIYPSLELVQPRKTRPYITERLLMGRKELNQTKFLSAVIFLEINLFEKFFQAYHLSVNQIGSRSGLIFCRA